MDTSSYPARWNCGEWTALEGWLHIGSDLAIFAAYLAIPLTILYFLWKRRDVQLHSVSLLFAAFILSCGFGHLLEAVIFYHPIYRVAGLLKLTTALVSLATVAALVRLLPRLLDLPSLASRNELLEQAATAKSEFLANMSHEIRTPLTAILGYADLLADGPASHGDAKKQHEAAHTIQQNGRHLLTIIDDVLDMSKIDAGQVRIERLPTNPARIANEVSDLLRRRAQGKGVSLRVAYDTPLPKQIDTDPTRVRQVLLNLIGNAIKFTEMGDVTVRVSHARKEGGDQLLFVIADTGIGMTPDQLDVIRRFQPFVQADGSTTRCFGGTGLGLTISAALAKLLGGSISVESEVGVGSAFTLTIDAGDLSQAEFVDPNETSPSPAPAEAPTQPSTNDVTESLEGAKILLVEDGPDNQCLISYLLERVGATVEVAENGRVGVDRVLGRVAQGDAFDLVLMDMQMPVLDGYEATRELRAKGYEGAIVALTAHAMADDRQRCLDFGCDDYLSKPIDRRKLYEVCQGHCQQPNGTAVGS